RIEYPQIASRKRCATTRTRWCSGLNEGTLSRGPRRGRKASSRNVSGSPERLPDGPATSIVAKFHLDRAKTRRPPLSRDDDEHLATAESRPKGFPWRSSTCNCTNQRRSRTGPARKRSTGGE